MRSVSLEELVIMQLLCQISREAGLVLVNCLGQFCNILVRCLEKLVITIVWVSSGEMSREAGNMHFTGQFQ